MEYQNAVCPICGKEFHKRRSNQKYCGRGCTMVAVNRRKTAKHRAKAKDCPYNNAVTCADSKCSTCGWNPDVAKQRMARLNYAEGHYDEG